jgi:hypothetical protein
MKWVCIDNSGYEDQLTIGKVYEEKGTFADTFCVIIKNDIGFVEEYYQPLRFVKQDEWRDLQIKKLGI